MAIIGYFGIPGCGKSTNLVRIARKELKRIKKKYDNIYTVNIDIKGCKRITKEDFRKYRFYNSLILWDEITLDYDNRNFKEFTQEDKESWLLHRHLGLDIIYATQNYENVDKKIKDITLELWYMNKSVIPILSGITTSKRIYRNITINENTSELTMGYRFCNFIESIFVSNIKICIRRLYYKYFDSFEELGLERRPLYEKEDNNTRTKKRLRLKIFRLFNNKTKERRNTNNLVETNTNENIDTPLFVKKENGEINKNNTIFNNNTIDNIYNSN